MLTKLKNENKYCTGCGACFNICPERAIKMQYHSDGSLCAFIDSSLCTDCGLCEQTCPVLNISDDNRPEPTCYAVWAEDDIRMVSSSGGIFTVLADIVLEQGGYICGAAFGEDLKVEHILISDKKDLYKLQRSKYVQSDTGRIFEEIRSLLNDGRVILFTGCPCQVVGLKRCLGKDYANLITIDILCNYAPGYPLIKKYVEDNFGIDNVKEIRFRTKHNGWKSEIHHVLLNNGEDSYRFIENDSFRKGFSPRLFMRPVCEKCLFSGLPRQGDLTIGDFWYIWEYKKELDDTKGTSLVLVNNKKGEHVFTEARKRLKLCEEVPLEYLKYNRPEKVSAHPERDRFFELLQKYSFNQALDYALNRKYDVGILGNWSERNYGSEITYYALYQTIRSFGLEPLMIERPAQVAWKPNNGPVLFRTQVYRPYDLCPLFNTKKEMKSLNKQCQTFIIGSDQLWHHELYDCFGQFCYLDYITNNKKKIAFATSFGREYWTGSEDDRAETAYYLSHFDHISVRETSGVSLCKDLFNVEATCVLDPVFLCDKQWYIHLASSSKINVPNNYIGAYILDPSATKQEALKYSGRQLDMELNVIADAFTDSKSSWEIESIKNAYNEDWLNNIISSQFVITDSFHGMCFAILFNKPFIAIANPDRGITRFTSILEKIGLMDRMVIDAKEILQKPELFKPINYDAVDKILDKERARSIQWLKEAIYSYKNANMLGYDILDNRVDGIDDVVTALDNELSLQAEGLARHEEAVVYHGGAILRMEPAMGKHEETLTHHEEALTHHQEALTHHQETLTHYQDIVSHQGARLTDIEARLDALYRSKSFRIGSMITYIPRKIKNLLRRCLERKEN